MPVNDRSITPADEARYLNRHRPAIQAIEAARSVDRAEAIAHARQVAAERRAEREQAQAPIDKEEFLRRLRKLSADAESIQSQLDSFWGVLSGALSGWELDLARESFVDLLKNWGHLAPAVEAWRQRQFKDEEHQR